MNIPHIKNDKINFKRVKEIISIMTKYGFSYFLEEMNLHKLMKFKIKHNEKKLYNINLSTPQKIKLIFEELGPVYIKLGQILSTRQDLIGVDLAKELAKLQDNTKPFSYFTIKSIIEQELGQKPEKLFKSFSQNPTASASIAQVHRATLHNDTKVVVKIQRPDIKEQAQEDIAIIRYFAKFATKHIENAKYFNLNAIIDEFERSLFKEIDFRQERQNVLRFAQIFDDDDGIYVPKVYDEFCTKKILTLEFIDGVKISDVYDSEKYSKDDKILIGKRGVDSFFKQIFDNGFFHADPHPGNILIMKDNVVSYLDFGMMGRIDKEFVNDLAEMFVYLIDYNVNGLISQLMNMGLIDETVDIKSLKYDIMDLMDIYFGAQLKELSLGNLVGKLMMILVKYKMTAPREMVMLSRAMSMVETIGKSLNPDFDIVGLLKPYAKKVIKKKLSPLNFMDTIREDTMEFEHLLKTFPKSMKEIVKRIKSGKVNVEIEHNNLDIFGADIERVTNKLIIAMIISSLIMGSSFIMDTNEMFGMGGFLLSGIMGLYLIWTILRFQEDKL